MRPTSNNLNNNGILRIARAFLAAWDPISKVCAGESELNARTRYAFADQIDKEFNIVPLNVIGKKLANEQMKHSHRG